MGPGTQAYEKDTSSPCSFSHKNWDISPVVHGDHFLSEGPADSLMKMNLAVEKIFQVKTDVIGPNPGQQREAKMFNRVVR